MILCIIACNVNLQYELDFMPTYVVEMWILILHVQVISLCIILSMENILGLGQLFEYITIYFLIAVHGFGWYI